MSLSTSPDSSDSSSDSSPLSTETGAAWGHYSVMRDECVAALDLQPGGLYLDCTLGAGGHSRAILMADPTVKVVGLDCDDQALAIAQERLSEFGDRFQTVREMSLALAAAGQTMGIKDLSSSLADTAQ